ncbi:Aryl-phospho-beta-D-glucosidase BglC, GH1 family [Streptomyces sp. 2231.1]|uniref:glycoside hydrolase family 5 protein n=1 Tax=Streptomyces sp. 2231.1 TaxID=1855347 RepID=UPI00089BE101|nr:cellulase family glycosylhydrolase [Streptomyces sp. 2231.1]SEC23435.1 Aryl-phospho-beta-D-glucosidase BglC, GH1 family [Streptomyces sp. 2231.1]
MPIASAGLRLACTAAGLLLVAATATTAGAAPSPPARAAHTAAASDPGTWSAPLSTRGRYIVDSRGDRFRLRAANWDGAQGSWTGSGSVLDPANHHAGQDSHGIPLGLDRVPLPQLMADFHELGINTVRLPFSNEMIHSTVPVPDAAVAANPRLRGRTPLEVYDAVVEALDRSGFAVILNNHTNTSRWCCGVDGNERWNSGQSTQTWADDWVYMARRYAGVPRVVGADLYNEVRRDVLDDPNWGMGDAHDWYAAAQAAGDRILTEADPRLLIVVEGINWTGIPVDGLPHGRPVLSPARTLSHTLVDAHKLVYSAHFYGYTGPHHSGATGIGETHDARYQDLNRDQLYATLEDEALFVEETGRHYTAPVWISEFGIGSGETNQAARTWFTNITDYFADHDTDFAYWPLVGHAGHDDWALLRYDDAGHRSGVLDADDWRGAAWRRLGETAGRTGPVAPVPVWRMLAVDHGDAAESLRVRATGDWDPGAYKAACPDGLRLIGLSHTRGRGLCTDSGADDLRSSTGGQTVVTDERHVPSGGDWASGYTKLQCPAGGFLAGYSVRGERVSAALCVPGRAPLAGAGRTVWFDRSDNRPADAAGGDFAQGDFKGQCAADEYAAGIAFTTRFGSRPGPDALLCRRLP